MEAFDIAGQKEVKNSTIGGKSNVDAFWVTQWTVLEHC
jgi:hypothetical protein